ncbi:hypothetical protein GKE82_21005 [Conexibacter sp. W3-3-2]|uniref:hypothetical protein n=1 Tax=Conexibacter sp. W3-3-2 TaxID=2675227 RepID=UPI0012B6C4FD|nr:hypothetical protein [Conexibacter sp. W3-3-2]MTD46700.1 hypothetical protein [Conexibacter sp. W3-3-2]
MSTDDWLFIGLILGVLFSAVAAIWLGTELPGQDATDGAGPIERWRTKAHREFARGVAVAKQIGENAKK